MVLCIPLWHVILGLSAVGYRSHIATLAPYSSSSIHSRSMRSQNDNLATNDSLTLLEELRGKALYDHQWVEAYWQATIGALQATNSLQENCHGKFLRWYTNVEGFSRQLESYSCAISFAFESQRTLLLPPIFTLHNIFDVENAMYLDEVVSLPLKFANVTVKHIPFAAKTQCNNKLNGFTRYSQNGTAALFPWAKQDRNIGQGPDLSFMRLVHESDHALTADQGNSLNPTSVTCVTSAPLSPCMAAIPFISSLHFQNIFKLVRSSLFAKDLRPNGPYFAVHWRTGDRCVGVERSGACGDPSGWMERLAAKAKQAHVHVYVATDATSVWRQAAIRTAGFISSRDFHFGTTAASASENGEGMGGLGRERQINAKDNLRSRDQSDLTVFVCELEMLIHADAAFYVQGERSTIQRLVNAARSAAALPFMQPV